METMGNDSHFLIIGQININSVNNKKSEVCLLLNECVDIDILCINDTRLTKSRRLKFKGYKTVRKDHKSGKPKAGGVAMLIKNSLKFYEQECDIEEMLVVETANGVRIATAYLHPGEVITL